MADSLISSTFPPLSNPTVSILICNYNYGRYLATAIESALNQTYPAINIIVVDDGSIDNSREIIEGYGSKISAIFRANGGQIAAVNEGLASCEGELVCVLDADDILEPNALESASFRFGADVVKIHFPLALIDAGGNLLHATIPRFLEAGALSTALRNGRLYGSAPGSGNIYRKSALIPLLPLPEDSEDR
ncbi:MAG: glycosyltransferase family 2 protein, partial [Nevskia sp.]|nr:glycosyltransferase family 2 protein [Nevskia sp.]